MGYNGASNKCASKGFLSWIWGAICNFYNQLRNAICFSSVFYAWWARTKNFSSRFWGRVLFSDNLGFHLANQESEHLQNSLAIRRRLRYWWQGKGRNKNVIRSNGNPKQNTTEIMIYLFSYELHPGFPRNTDSLIKNIKSFDAWAQCQASTWLIAAHEQEIAPEQVMQRLRQHLRATDSVVLVPINRSGLWANFPQPIWDWVDQMQKQGY